MHPPARVEALDQQRARRDGGQQQVLVERQGFPRLLRILAVGLAVPVREHGVLGRGVLAIVALGERRAAAAGLVGHAHREALVARGGDERRLAEARAARHDAALRVQERIGLRIVETARKRPRPRAQRCGVVVAGFVALRPEVEHARIGERVLAEGGILFLAGRIGRHLAVARAHDGVAARKQHADGEDAVAVGVALDAARAFGGLVAVGLGARARPPLLDGDVLIRHQFVVAAIVEEEDHGRRRGGVARRKDDPVDAGAGTILLEPHLHLLADAVAGQGLVLDVPDLRDDGFGRRRRLTVHFAREDVENLGAALRPLVRRLQLGAVRKRERIFKRIGMNLGFIVVRLTEGLVAGGSPYADTCHQNGKHA